MSANEVKIWEQIDLNRDTDVAKELDDYEDVIKKLHQGVRYIQRGLNHTGSFSEPTG